MTYNRGNTIGLRLVGMLIWKRHLFFIQQITEAKDGFFVLGQDLKASSVNHQETAANLIFASTMLNIIDYIESFEKEKRHNNSNYFSIW